MLRQTDKYNYNIDVGFLYFSGAEREPQGSHEVGKI